MNNFLTTLIALILISITCEATQTSPSSLEKCPKRIENIEKSKPFVEAPQEKTSLEMAKESCLDNNAQGCIDHGYLLIQKDNYDDAIISFNKAFFLGFEDEGLRGKYYIKCLGKDPEGCYLFGYMAENGKGGEQNATLAQNAYAFNLKK